MLGVCAMLCSFSCSDDKEENGSVEDLIGTWIPVENVDIVKYNGKIVDEDSDVSHLHILEFRADGTYYGYGSDDGVLYEEAVYTYKNGVVTLTNIDEDGSIYSEVMPLKSLTSDELVIEETEIEKEGDDTYEYYYKAVWKKKK